MQQLEETLHVLARQDAAIDTEELIDRIEQRLSGVGVPVVAQDRSPTMQTQEKPRAVQARLPTRAWVLATTLVAVFAAIVIPVWLVGGEAPTDVVSQSEGVFMWGEDISEWVTEEEMLNTLEDLSIRHVGTGLVDGEFEFELKESGCGWPVGECRFLSWVWIWLPERSARIWAVTVGNDEWRDSGPELSDTRLPAGVVMQQDWGFGFILRGPNSSETVSIGLQADPWLTPRGPDWPSMTEPYYDAYFDLASMVLRELRWAD